MLKKIRLFLALLVFVPMCLAFAVSERGMHLHVLSIPAKLQLVPAILSGSVAVVLALAVITLLFGRVYCSVLCPLGTAQDALARIGGGKRHAYRPARTWLRLAGLGLFIAGFIAGMPLLFSVLEPYSIFGRTAANTVTPLVRAGGDMLSGFPSATGSQPASFAAIWSGGTAVFLVSTATFGLIALLAVRRGRAWCNTLCPVGTALGLLSGISFFRPRINHGSCTGCGRCARACKASCIDSVNKKVDGSRCVGCFNCLSACKHGSLALLPSRSGKQ